MAGTRRQITSDGGNGWTGFDGTDMNLLNEALKATVKEAGATGMIDRFILREEPLLTVDQEIDSLFD